MPTEVEVDETKVRLLLKEQGELRSKEWLDALVQKWTERRTVLLQCSKLAAGRGAYTEANTMQIRADTTLQCLEELAELRQASNDPDQRPGANT